MTVLDDLILYELPGCPFCAKVDRFLKQNDLEVERRMITEGIPAHACRGGGEGGGLLRPQGSLPRALDAVAPSALCLELRIDLQLELQYGLVFFELASLPEAELVVHVQAQLVIRLGGQVQHMRAVISEVLDDPRQRRCRRRRFRRRARRRDARGCFLLPAPASSR